MPITYEHFAKSASRSNLRLKRKLLGVRDAPDYLDEGGILVVEVGNTATELERRFPDLPFLWLEFERGGEGVFLMTREQLAEFHALFENELENL